MYLKHLLLLWILVLCVGAAPLTGQLLNDTERRILHAQDQRDAVTLLNLLQGGDPEVLSRAAVAAGSIQDTLHIWQLAALVRNAFPEVRAAAAFALGQMNPVSSASQRRFISITLLDALHAEPDQDVQRQLIDALGKVGDAESLDRLIRFAEHNSNLYLNEDVALSVGRYAYRGIKDTSGTRFAAEVLAEADDAERWKAAYALMRVGERSLMMPYASVMLAQANCSDEDARMFIQTVLGRLGDTRALPGLVARVKNDSDWRVRVNAVKALAQFDPALWDTVLAILADACLDTSALVRLTAIASIGSLSLMDTVLLDDVVPVLIRVIEDQTGERSRTEKEEAAIAFARLRGNGSYSHLKRMLDQGSLDREAYLKSLGYVNDSTVLNDLLPAANDKNARTRRVALEAIQNLGARKVLPIVQLPHARQAIIDALQAEDLAVLTTAASALGDSAFADASSVEPLLNLLRRLHSPDDVEAMVAIVQSLGVLKDERVIPDLSLLLEDPDRTVAMESAIALEQITGASSVAKVKLHTLPQHTDYDWEMLEAIASRPRVVVVTTKGSFEFELMVEQAPFTCLSFARLISRGFYDGLTFHRVVPNFVVQGGDPRGDGWGGPGYAIRSEFWPNMYERGMVGVASAGKDTEGCQFFVTHSRQPHLDGRYTIFGRVISGMEVVDRLEVGDHIRSMRFLESLQGR